MPMCISTSGNCIAATASFMLSRYFASLSASAASVLASRLTANNPALAAPASPIANVATGIPFGICTMEYSESCPAKCFDGTGTPSTGRVVLLAIMPGKCAAPPAPAIMHLSPRSRAVAAYSNIASGVRCAETTLCSKATPKSRSTSTARCITSQSEFEPMTTPTIALLMLVFQ